MRSDGLLFFSQLRELVFFALMLAGKDFCPEKCITKESHLCYKMGSENKILAYNSNIG